jgi:tRNA-dihydrouridine synthase 2
VIANGISSNNRKSSTNTYSGLRSIWKDSGASSLMIARAAEWNPSVFKPEGKESTNEVST